jgi:hypothetical protein
MAIGRQRFCGPLSDAHLQAEVIPRWVGLICGVDFRDRSTAFFAFPGILDSGWKNGPKVYLAGVSSWQLWKNDINGTSNGLSIAILCGNRYLLLLFPQLRPPVHAIVIHKLISLPRENLVLY